jgi:hypothetical protein
LLKKIKKTQYGIHAWNSALLHGIGTPYFCITVIITTPGGMTGMKPYCILKCVFLFFLFYYRYYTLKNASPEASSCCV